MNEHCTKTTKTQTNTPPLTSHSVCEQNIELHLHRMQGLINLELITTLKSVFTVAVFNFSSAL